MTDTPEIERTANFYTLARRKAISTYNVEVHFAETVVPAEEYHALRADRVKLQDENASLRADLSRALSKLGLLGDGMPPETDLDTMAETLRPVKVEADIEVLAERLAKVEDRLAAFEQLTAKHPDVPLGFGQHTAFPTGAATTAEEVLEQVEEAGQPSADGPPRRGDRVWLEGARSVGGRRIPDGWYDVAGSTPGDFQVAKTPFNFYWVDCRDAGLKEVRRGAANLSE